MRDQQGGTLRGVGGAGRPMGRATDGRNGKSADVREHAPEPIHENGEGAPAMRFPAALTDLSDEIEDDGLGSDTLPPGADPHSELWLRIRARKLIREFLRAVPRSESEITLAIVRPDGVTRIFTRAELSAAIDRLRPRQRQILRLGVEERWPRPKVCAYLHDISMKTFERDQVEALDILADL
jgi:hypothetical protein